MSQPTSSSLSPAAPSSSCCSSSRRCSAWRAASSSPTRPTSPRSPQLDDYAPSTISRVYGARGEIVGEFAIQRREVIPYEAISPKLEQAILAAEDAGFEQHFGLSIPRIIVTLVNDIIERRMHGASTLTQQLARKLFLTDDKTPGAQDQGSDPRDPDREALHQARDLHALLQPDVLRPRRLRRRGRVAALLRQVGEGRHPRGGGAHRRHPPGQRAAEPVREHGGGAAAAELRARPHGGRRLHHRGARPRRRKKKPIVVRAGSAGPEPVGGAVFPRGGPQGARGAVRREAALRERPVDSDRARPAAAGSRQPRARRRACAASTSAAASASRAGTSSPRGTRSRPSASRAGSGRCASDDIVPAVVTGADGDVDPAARRRRCKSRSTRRASPGRTSRRLPSW